MSMRDEILAKVRGAVSSTPVEKRHMAVQQRMDELEVGVQPYEISKKAEMIDLFVQKAEAAAATVVKCAASKVEGEVLDYLRSNNLPLEIKTGENPDLERYKIGKHKLLSVETGRTHGDDMVTISTAACGVAETGTLALTSGADNPSSLNFLPENHIVILKQSDIALHQEAVWELLREKYGKGGMPRTMNFITGPSRSADIEQTMILGAHGPIRLHIIVVSN